MQAPKAMLCRDFKRRLAKNNAQHHFRELAQHCAGIVACSHVIEQLSPCRSMAAFEPGELGQPLAREDLPAHVAALLPLPPPLQPPQPAPVSPPPAQPASPAVAKARMRCPFGHPCMFW